jgi:hypothetical protein
LIDEFVHGYYGDAVAPLIKQYWDVLIAQAEKEKIYLGCFGMNSAKWIDLPTLNQVTEIMNQAVETARNVYGSDSEQLRRLRKSKMGVDHVWLSRYCPLRCEAREKKLPFLGPKDPLQAAEEFAQLCKRFKTKAAVISQEGKFDLYLEGLMAGFIGSFDKKFRGIDLDVVDFVPGAYFWFAHGHRPELDAIFVDRVVLIGAE